MPSSATSRPTLIMTSISPVDGAATDITSDTLTGLNSVTTSAVDHQLLMLPQRSIYFQTRLEGIGANFNWSVSELLISIKPRGLR